MWNGDRCEDHPKRFHYKRRDAGFREWWEWRCKVCELGELEARIEALNIEMADQRSKYREMLWKFFKIRAGKPHTAKK